MNVWGIAESNEGTFYVTRDGQPYGSSLRTMAKARRAMKALREEAERVQAERDAEEAIHGPLTEDQSLRARVAASLVWAAERDQRTVECAIQDLNFAQMSGDYAQVARVASGHDLADAAEAVAQTRRWVAVLLFSGEDAVTLREAAIRKLVNSAGSRGTMFRMSDAEARITAAVAAKIGDNTGLPSHTRGIYAV